MKDLVREARLYFVLLAICTFGRWGMGIGGIPYERGHQVFSIVILTALSCIYYPAFLRRQRGHGVMRGMALGTLFGLASQSVILLSTVLSYALGLETYFNHPRALNVEQAIGFGAALGTRLLGLVANTLTSAVAGALGWALGGLLPPAESGPRS
jgi:hypothetical protein